MPMCIAVQTFTEESLFRDLYKWKTQACMRVNHYEVTEAKTSAGQAEVENV